SKIQFILIGKAGDANKTAVSPDFLNNWADGEYVIWKGHVKNVLEEYIECNLVVLPSYREGLPKNLIEACAIGRPIVTTDAVGCKDCVDSDLNGVKVPIKNSIKLAEAIKDII